MKKLTREDLTDILYGCAVLGTGGGGSLDEGLAMIDEALAAGREFAVCALSPRGRSIPESRRLGRPVSFRRW